MDPDAANLAAQLLGVPPAARPRVLEGAIVAKVAGVLGRPPAAIDAAVPIAELGLDSMTMLALKDDLEQSLGITVPLEGFLADPSLATLATTALALLEAKSAATAAS